MTNTEAARPQENPALTSGLAKMTAAVYRFPSLVDASIAGFPVTGVKPTDPSAPRVEVTAAFGQGRREGALIFSPAIVIDEAPYMRARLRVHEVADDEIGQSAITAAVWGLTVPADPLNMNGDERSAVLLASMDALGRDTKKRLDDIAFDVGKMRYSNTTAEFYRASLRSTLEAIGAQRKSVKAGTAKHDLDTRSASLILLTVNAK